MPARQFDPNELEALESADLRAVAGVKYLSQVIPVRRGFAYLWNVDVVGDATLGDFKLTVEVMRKNETDVLFPKDIVTAISSVGGGGKVSHQVTWGGGVTALVDSPTGAIGNNVDILKVMGFIRLVVEVTTQADGTAGTVNAISELLIEETGGRTP